jgi:tetratricopeptide (TPR) repeat protein
MREQLYMVVDGRRDHSFRVPRPDLSPATGAPNACNDCHRDRSADWAAKVIALHFGTTRRQTPHYGQALAAGRAGAADAPDQLRAVLAEASAPAIARATALSLLAPDLAADDPALRKALKDPDPLVRRAAAEALESLAPGPRLDLGGPLLQDPVRTVRLAAFGSFMGVPPEQVLAEERPALQAAAAEYRAAQQQNADRAEGQLNLGLLESSLGNAAAAEQAYRAALSREPGFVPAYVNLADLLARTGREGEADELLRQALELEPDNAGAYHALGLSLVRQQKLAAAVPELARARELQPGNARFAYVYAVALHETGRRRQALEVLEAAQARHPNDGDIAAALAAYRANPAP